MAQRLGPKLVPGGLWQIVEPLVPPQAERPPGGGTRYVEDRAVCTAIVDVLRAGGAGRPLPAEFGVSKAATLPRHRRWSSAPRSNFRAMAFDGSSRWMVSSRCRSGPNEGWPPTLFGV